VGCNGQKALHPRKTTLKQLDTLKRVQGCRVSEMSTQLFFRGKNHEKADKSVRTGHWRPDKDTPFKGTKKSFNRVGNVYTDQCSYRYSQYHSTIKTGGYFSD
jgi:uncharacterized protein YvpB